MARVNITNNQSEPLTMSLTANEYASYDAIGLAELVSRKEVSPRELVDVAIEQVQQLNPSINAVITRMYERAQAEAGVLSSGGAVTGPFHGVPFLMKDYCAEVKGERFTECSSFLGDYISPQDSELYRRFVRSGLVTIGKTNLPEFAFGPTTEPRRFGASCNPWDTTRTTGGSSGGAGAAVASRLVPMAHGNDVGGSIRVPASCCGLVGLKPSRGRNSVAPQYGDLLAGFFVEHALTRSVRDCAVLLDAVAGPVAGDPYYAPLPTRPFADELKAKPERLKIGFSDRRPDGEAIDDECAQAVHRTVGLLESLGHSVELAAPSFNVEKLWMGFTQMMACGAAWSMADWARRLNKVPKEDDFEPFIWAFAEHGRQLSGADYLLAMQDTQVEVRAMSQFYTDYDVFVTPTLGKLPVELGTLVYKGDPIELRRRCAEFTPYTYVSNVSGQPSLSLPLQMSSTGLPIGIHFTAQYADEALLLRLAAQLEIAEPWAERRPPVCVA